MGHCQVVNCDFSLLSALQDKVLKKIKRTGFARLRSCKTIIQSQALSEEMNRRVHLAKFKILVTPIVLKKLLSNLTNRYFG